jgi:hypothetical protein
VMTDEAASPAYESDLSCLVVGHIVFSLTTNVAGEPRGVSIGRTR